MIDFQGYAVRKDLAVEVTMWGSLADSCHRAAITGYYPGTIFHVIDPGHAEIFIKEWMATDPGTMCTLALVPWFATLRIISDHEEINVFINEKAYTIPVLTEDQFSVWELTGGIVPPNGSCSIVPATVELPSVYTKRFGPENYKACSEYVLQNCGRLVAADFTGNDGGGSGSPLAIY